MLCYAGTSTDRAQQTLDVVLDEIERLGSSGVALDELETMRAGLKSSLIMAQESSMSRSGSLASDWFFLGRVRPIEEIAQRARRALARGGFRVRGAGCRASGEPTIVTLGPDCPAASALRWTSARAGRGRFRILGIRSVSPVASRNGRKSCNFTTLRSTTGSK